MLHVRICAGGGPQGPSLPRPDLQDLGIVATATGEVPATGHGQEGAGIASAA
jgi:hypothetical protein